MASRSSEQEGNGTQAAFVSAPAIGKLQKVMGSVTITRANVVVAQPAVGDLVYEGDLIETGIDGLVSVVFVDGTTFHLDASAHMVLDEFVFAAESSANSALFHVLRGRFNFFSGLLAASGRLIIDTAVARIQNTRPAAGIGGLAFSVFTIGLIHELNAASADIALLDDGTITCKDLKHGVFEIITKGDHPQRVLMDDPCVSKTFLIVGSQVQVSEVANTPGQMALFHEAFLGTLNTYLQGQQDPFIRQWQEANAGPQSTGSMGSSTEPGLPTGLASLSLGNGPNINLSGSGSGGGTTTGTTTTAGGAEIIPLNVIWSGSGNWPTSLSDWSDGAQPLPIQNVIVDPTKVTFDTTASILGLTVNAGAILNMTGGALTVTEGITNAGLIEINSSGVDPTLAISGSQSLTGGGAIWLRPPTPANPAANMIIAVGASTLTNVNNTIFGSGTIGEGTGSPIGSLTLVNDATGTIDALGGTLVLGTGHVINTSGILAAGLVTPLITTITTTSPITGGTPTGGTLQIDDVVDNAGLIYATASGILDIQTDLITWTGGTPSAGINGIWLDLGGTLEVDVANLQLTGGGVVYMTGGAITGAASTDILENVDNTISGYGTIGGAGEALTLQNDALGTIDADSGGHTLLIEALTGLTNAGTLEADGATLQIDDTPVTNSNELLATGDGTVILSGGTVVTNTGTVEADDATSTIELESATISGGTVETGADGVIEATSGTSTVENVTTFTNAGLLEAIDGATLVLSGETITNTGGTVEADDATSTIELESVTISGGTVETGADGVIEATSGTSTIENVTTFTNAGLLEAIDGATLVLSGETVTNDGQVTAAGSSSEVVFEGAVTNESDGTMTVDSGGTFDVKTESISNADVTDGIEVDGTFEVDVGAGNTLTLSGDGELRLVGGTITGVLGTEELVNDSNNITGYGEIEQLALLQNDSGGTIDANVAGQTLTIDVNTLINELGGMVEATAGTLIINEVANGSANYGTIEAIDGGSLTINHDNGSSATNEASGVVEALDGGTVTFNDNRSEQNLGTIEADDGTININFVYDIGSGGGNFGTIEAISSGTVNITGGITNESGATIEANGSGSIVNLSDTLSDASIENIGTILAENGGTVEFTDAFVPNAGGTITASGTGSTIDLSFTRINDGALTIGSGATLDVEAPGATLDGVNVTNNGTMTVNGSLLDVTSTSTVSGSGTVLIENGGYAFFADAFDQNVTVSGAGTLALAQSYSGTITGFGADDALVLTNIPYEASHTLALWDSSDNTLIITNGLLIETIQLAGEPAGRLHFTAVSDPLGGIAVFYGAEDEWTDTSGTHSWIIVSNWGDGVPTSALNAVIDLSGTYTITIATTDNGGAGDSANSLTISDVDATLSGAGTLTIPTIINSGTIDANVSGETLTLDSSNPIINTGTLEAASGATLQINDIAIQNLDNITVDGTLSVDATGGTLALASATGTGTVVLSDGMIIAAAAGETLANYDNVISGYGQIGDGSGALTLDNAQGTIAANVSGQTLTVDTLHTITNMGTLEASNGGTLMIDDPVSNSGAGNALIEGGIVDFASTTNVNEIMFNNGSGYGELILGDPTNGYSATINGFTGTAPLLSTSDGIDLHGSWTTTSPLTGSGGNLVVALTDGSGDTLTLTFDDFSGTLNIASDGHGGTLITDPPATSQANPSVSIGGLGNDNFVFPPGLGTDAGSFNPQADPTEFAQFNSPLEQHWLSQIKEDAIECVHAGEANTLTDLDTAHWHAPHNAFLLH